MPVLSPQRDAAPVRPLAAAGAESTRRSWRSLPGRLVRYAGVSAVSTTVSLAVLGMLVGTGTLGGAYANVVATAVGTGPSFELNRRWVWGRRGRRSVRAEIGPFCALSLAALGLSTVVVGLVDRWATASGLTGSARALASDAASLAAFGSLWVVQYLVLDRVLFSGGRLAGSDLAPSVRRTGRRRPE